MRNTVKRTFVWVSTEASGKQIIPICSSGGWERGNGGRVRVKVESADPWTPQSAPAAICISWPHRWSGSAQMPIQKFSMHRGLDGTTPTSPHPLHIHFDQSDCLYRAKAIHPGNSHYFIVKKENWHSPQKQQESAEKARKYLKRALMFFSSTTGVEPFSEISHSSPTYSF